MSRVETKATSVPTSLDTSFTSNSHQSDDDSSDDDLQMLLRNAKPVSTANNPDDLCGGVYSTAAVLTHNQSKSASIGYPPTKKRIVSTEVVDLAKACNAEV